MRSWVAIQKAKNVIHAVVTLGAGLGLALDATAAETVAGPVRYEIRAVHTEGAAASVLYRLDSASGEICAFGFAKAPTGEPRGCIAGTLEGPPGRFTLQAVQGARGTGQSSAYRLDQLTGEICRFRLPVTTGPSLEAVGCVAKPAAAAAR